MFSEQFYINPALAKNALSGNLILNITGFIISNNVGCNIPAMKQPVLHAFNSVKINSCHLKFMKS